MIRELINAFGFLSIFPVKNDQSYESGDLGRAAGWFPLVGTVMGLIAAGANYLLGFVFPPIVRAVIITALWIALSGGLHLDGLTDSFDGMINASSPERRLEIMKDPRMGTFGGIGLVVTILTKFSIISTVDPLKSVFIFPFVMGVSRWLLLWAGKQASARPGGMGAEFTSGLQPKSFIIGGAFVLLLTAASFFQTGWVALIALLLAHLTAFLIFRVAANRLGGLTGDIFGLIVEISEIIMLLSFCAKG